MRLVYPHPNDEHPVELHARNELVSFCQKSTMINFGPPKDSIAPAAPGKLKTAFYVAERDCLEVRVTSALHADCIAMSETPLSLSLSSFLFKTDGTRFHHQWTQSAGT